MTGKFKWLLAAIVAAAILPAAAQAQTPFYGWGYGGWGQPGYGQGVYQGSGYRPPYFALHPPVYYSHEIMRRPMGDSPYAYPSWYSRSMSQADMAAAVPAAQPVMIQNPFVKKAE